MSLKLLIVVGTRPEAIKLAPVVRECRRRKGIDLTVCTTGQHRDLLQSECGIQNFTWDMGVMGDDQSLAITTARCLEGIDQAILDYQPRVLVAQGDTATVFAAATAAFYHHVPLVHVEAGLRTHDLQDPWPEEMIRVHADRLADLCCAPTYVDEYNLRKEGIPQGQIVHTGNTIVDEIEYLRQSWGPTEPVDGRLVLVTCHRRENFGGGLRRVCGAVVALAHVFPEVEFIWPLHPNPNISGVVPFLVADIPNIRTIPPVRHAAMLSMLSRAELVLTDSGGLQEEAPSFGKPVVVLREKTERTLTVEAGSAFLCGTDEAKIVKQTTRLLQDGEAYAKAVPVSNPYGDGHAAVRIVDAIEERYA